MLRRPPCRFLPRRMNRSSAPHRTAAEKELDQRSLRLGSVITFPDARGQTWSSALSTWRLGMVLRGKPTWIGMIIYGNRQPCIGNLAKKPKTPSSSKNS